MYVLARGQLSNQTCVRLARLRKGLSLSDQEVCHSGPPVATLPPARVRRRQRQLSHLQLSELTQALNGGATIIQSYNQKLWMHHLIEGAAYLSL